MFEKVKVDSTAISEVSYDKETKTLRIQFVRGAEYDYPEVPEVEFRKLVSAPSVGKYYNSHIKQYAVAR
jgi:lysyl-tRNA synthetase class 2